MMRQIALLSKIHVRWNVYLHYCVHHFILKMVTLFRIQILLLKRTLVLQFIVN